MPCPTPTRDIYLTRYVKHSICPEPRFVLHCAKKTIPIGAGRNESTEYQASSGRVKFEKPALAEIVELPVFRTLRQAQWQYRRSNFFRRWQRQRIDSGKCARVHAGARGTGAEEVGPYRGGRTLRRIGSHKYLEGRLRGRVGERISL